MRIVEGLSQNTPEWSVYRRQHIGGSESAVVMGMNPWRTKQSLWEEKVFGWEQEFNQKSLDRMAEGTAMEPIARMAYQELTGFITEPMVAESTSYPFLSASFDGMAYDFSNAVEIKCGASSHKSAKEGLLPAYYTCQIQHQMLVSGLDWIHYFSYYKGEGILIHVVRDDDLIKEMVEKEIEFWHHVQAGTPPED